MKKIRIAQIGTSQNSHGNDIFNRIKQADDIFEVVGYAMPENEREKYPWKMTDFEGYPELAVDEIINDPTIDAVTVETEEKYLTKYALLAAEHKKHLHMEKPGSACAADFKKLIETAEKNKTVFHIGYMYRYNPVISKLIEEIKNGGLGKIVSVEAHMSCRHNDDVRKWLEDYKGGMMFFLGCHLADLVLRIMGKPNKIIPLNRASGLNGINSEDCGLALFEYDTGISLIKACDVETGGYAMRHLTVTGEEKTVEIRPLEMYGENNLYTETAEYKKSDDWGDLVGRTRCEEYDRFMPMMRAFAKMVRGEIENPYTYDYEYELYKTVLKCCGI